MLIGELAEKTGLATSTIRFYEKEGLLQPPKRGSGNYRHYGDADLRQVRRIQTGQKLGLSLKVIRGLIRIDNEGHVQRTLEKVDERLLEVSSLQAALSEQQRALMAARALLERAVSGEQPLECTVDAH